MIPPRQRDAAAALRRRLEAWAPIARHAAEPMLVLDGEGRVASVNRPFAGLAPATLVGKPFSSLVDAGAAAAVDAAVRDALHPGLAHSLDAAVMDLEAERRYRIALSPLKADGRPIGVHVVCLDVTAQKREEERLRRSERLMVDTQGTAHLGTWEWDVSEPTAVWSEELFRIYGLDPATHVPTYQDYLTRVHPDDRERVQKATEAVLFEKRPYAHDERILHTDGTFRYLHTWAHPILGPDGSVVRLLGVCQDITDRKTAEIALAESDARFRAIFEGAPLGIATVCEDLVLMNVNPTFRSLVGRSEVEIDGCSLAEIVVEDDVEQVTSAVAELFRGERDVHRGAVCLRGASGESLWANLTLSRVAPGEGTPFLVLMVEDISVQRRAEGADRLAESRLTKIQELEEVSRWKSRLIDVASHEMKNPLTPILVQLEILQRGRYGELNEGQAGALGKVRRQAERIVLLLTDLLETARLERGLLRLHMKPTDVTSCLSEAAEPFLALAEASEITFERAIEAGLFGTVDGERLEQVLQNLVGNAFELTPDGGRVRLSAAATPEGCHITVADTGPGLAREQVERVFEPFTQFHKRSERRRAGTGLGLYITKSIVDAHEGRIWVEAPPGAGAVFHVVLPQVRAG